MVHTVGIIGTNGNLGAPLVQFLAQSAKEGKINLIVLHREGSKIPNLASEAENIFFRTTSLDDPMEKILEAVSGIDIFISTLGFGALPQEPRLVEALAQSKDLITYIPSVYSTTWNKTDHEDPHLGPILDFLHEGLNKAKELGVPVTQVYTGIFENYWFEYGSISRLPSYVKHPLGLSLPHPQPHPHRLPPHLAESISSLTTAPDPAATIANKSFSVVTFWPTGHELVDLYSKLHGTKANVKNWTKEDREALMEDAANFGPAKAGYWDKWASNGFEYDKYEDGAVKYEGPGLEEVAKIFL